MLDLADGGAGVIRNAGTVIDDDSVRSLVVSTSRCVLREDAWGRSWRSSCMRLQTPVDLSAVVTNSHGWAHARRVAEAVTTTDGPSRSFSQPCSAARQMKNTQLCGCLGGGPGRTRAAGLPL
jgi:hypothetical protein